MNNEKVLYVTVGLPRSGKSTLAKTIMSNTGGAIVNRDTIRLVAHGHVFRQEAEPLITFIEDTMVRSLMTSETPCIIIDSTNTLPGFRNKWRNLAKIHEYTINFVCMRTGPVECIKRACDSNRSDLIPIIEKMSQYLTFPSVNYLTGYDFEPELKE